MNIFENVYFGKPYKTRDERKALYLWSNGKDEHSLMLDKDSSKKPHHYNNEGKWYSQVEAQNPLDIISEWGEPINEEELERLADIAFQERVIIAKQCEANGQCYGFGYTEGFIDGYRSKEKEE